MSSLFSALSSAHSSLNRLSQADLGAARAVSRLATGLRVQGGADDAAGLGISERLTASIRAHGAIGRGLNDAIGQVQHADQGLSRIGEMLQRARELAVESGNGALGDDDRAHLQQEYQSLLSQIDATADGTRLFGTSLLQAQRPSGHTPYLSEVFSSAGNSVSMSSGLRPVAYIPAGVRDVTLNIDALGADDDLQLFTLQGQQLLGTAPTDSSWRANGVEDADSLTQAVMQTELGFLPGAHYDDSALLDGRAGFADPQIVTSHALPLVSQFSGMTISYSGDGDQHDSGVDDGIVSGSYRYEALSIDTVTEALLVMVVGAGSFTAQGVWTEADDGSTLLANSAGNTLSVVLQADFGAATETMSLTRLPSDTAALGLSSSGIASQEAAQASLGLLDRAIDRVGEHRGQLGAQASRIERAIDQTAGQDETLVAARGRIIDADLALELSERARHQVQSEAARSLLVQAMQMPGRTLNLLLGSP